MISCPLQIFRNNLLTLILKFPILLLEKVLITYQIQIRISRSFPRIQAINLPKILQQWLLSKKIDSSAFLTLLLIATTAKYYVSKKRHILTPKEFKLLQLLINKHSEVLSRKTIMQTVWETDYMGDTRTLDVHIRWIREKIEENPSRPKHLVTIRKRGYRFIMAPDI